MLLFRFYPEAVIVIVKGLSVTLVATIIKMDFCLLLRWQP